MKSDPQAFAALRDATIYALHHHSFLRTNQFEVESRLDGLEERFAVADRDELAGALKDRRARLAEQATKFTPDILHFLLQLSDRPTEDASLDELEDLCASRIAPESPPLRWEDISREDGWADEPDLWQRSRRQGKPRARDNDYEDDYDDEEDYNDGDGDDSEQGARSEDTTLSSVEAPSTLQQPRSYHDPDADERSRAELAVLLDAVRASQAWRAQKAAAVTFSTSGAQAEPGPRSTEQVLLFELQIVREALYMLQGLETTLFGTDCVVVNGYQLASVSPHVYVSLLESIAASGRKLMPLRRRLARAQRGTSSSPVPLLQMFEDAIRRRLQEFHREVSGVEAHFVVDPSSDRSRGDSVPIVSLVAVMDVLQPSLLCLSALSAVVQTLEAERNAHAFRYLELLFDTTCLAQLEGEQALYVFLGTIFLECFQVYLRPIRTWMEDGRLLEGSERMFFVAGAQAQLPLAKIWRGQYKLLRTSRGVLHAPRFLQPAANKIFTTGKSIVVLRHLGRLDTLSVATGGSRRSEDVEPPLDFAAVCPCGTELAPFAQLFGDAFEQWIQSKHHAAAATLQRTLFDACGLWASLEALHCVYLMADGAAVDAFASRVFHSLDTRNPRWHDRYTLTELARDAFGSRIEAHRLSVTVSGQDGRGQRRAADSKDGKDGNDPSEARRSLRNGLARISVAYRLPWPVQIVILAECIASYQAVFTFLLQVRRASSLLSQHRLLDDGNDVRTSASRGGGRGAAGDMAADRSRLPAGDRALYFTLRARLLWFCNMLQSYLVTVVIAPRIDVLRMALQRAADVDAMSAEHAQTLKALVDEACLGAKLQPIHGAMVDLLDLALRLEDAHRANAAREASELQETWRLSVLSSPYQQTPTKKTAGTRTLLQAGSPSRVRRRLFVSTPPRAGGRQGLNDLDDEDDEDDEEQNMGDEDDQDDDLVNDWNDEHDGGLTAAKTESYTQTLQGISTELSNSLRFVTEGLRAVARASSDATAVAKWNTLADMLGDGSRRTGMTRF